MEFEKNDPKIKRIEISLSCKRAKPNSQNGGIYREKIKEISCENIANFDLFQKGEISSLRRGPCAGVLWAAGAAGKRS